jgi:hypothetical protein
VSRLLYFYGFVPPGTAAPPLPGVGGGGVRLEALDGFAAVVGEVDAEAFSAHRIEERMSDLAWVGEQGLLHERIVAWFVDHASILPAPLLTLYSSGDALRADADARAPEIRELLHRFRDVREWDLKVSVDRERAAEAAAALSPAVRRLDEEIRDAPPGRRYLLNRKRESSLRAEVHTAARARAGQLLDELRELARDVVVLPAPRAAAELPVVLSAALLVAAGDEPALQARTAPAAADLAQLGIRVALTGPWAPYRFLGSGHE